MKLKGLDYAEIIESFTNRYETIVKKMRFQQRQQQERDQRKVDMISTGTKTATSSTITANQPGVNTSSTLRSTTVSAYSSTTVTTVASSNTTSPSASGPTDLSATLGAGKVRQMFDERRAHRGAGIDKSYPLQPIQPKVVASSNNSNNNTSGISNGMANGNGPRSGAAAAGGLNNKTRVPPISANTRARLALQARQQENGNEEIPKNTTFDDNENLLEDEKFPDTISLDDDSSFATLSSGHQITRKLPNVGKSNVAVSQPNVNSLKLKPVPGRAPTGAGIKPASTPKLVPKKTCPAASVPPSSSSPSPTGSRSSQPSSAKSSTSRASTSGKTAAMALSRRKPSTASSTLSATGSLTPSAAGFSIDGPTPVGLTRCSICNRNFADERIAKHREICMKTKSKKRKVFDTTKQRVAGTEAEKYLGKKKPGAGGSKKSISAPAGVGPTAGGSERRKSDWRRKHEEFIQAIRAAKEMQAHLARGGKLSDLPPPPPSENPDYIQCPHCSRRFNQTAAERHIPKCANMLHNKPKPNQPKGKRF
ncbi:mucin-5AC isoform X2 [Topomyia yanbarensis]|uniref:mucin-5AC isoform X2 n=1 Tax=Topomyia yanbarensis TaxID=2498891 RepID=UPI00273C98C0|nr:mucin-5AC isoform X2 [Topomyia yanbarensis]